MKVVHIHGNEVRRALEQLIEPVKGHLDLEGFCYLRITRTSAKDCFASDVTDTKMTRREVAKLWLEHPACEKWGTEDIIEKV